MEILLIGIVIVVAALLLRPAQRSQIIYMPVPVSAAEPPAARIGCLPLIVVMVLVVLALGIIRL